MNRKDLELISRVVRSIPDASVPVSHRTDMAHRFAKALDGADGCAGFDRVKFLKQCGAT